MGVIEGFADNHCARMKYREDFTGLYVWLLIKGMLKKKSSIKISNKIVPRFAVLSLNPFSSVWPTVSIRLQ